MNFFAKILTLLGVGAANVGTTGCSWLIADEAKMPRSLLNK